MFEDNDDCPTAAPLGDGTYLQLKVTEDDNDYFTFSVPDVGTVDATILFTNSDGDLDLYLWDPLIACDTNVDGTGGAFLVRSFSVSDEESLSYTNLTGAPQTLVLEVDMFTAGGCNLYDLILVGAEPGGASIGTPYCMANPNSTGIISMISATGSVVVTDNDVTLAATNLPLRTFGFFLASMAQGFTPSAGGSQGNLCVGSNIGRFVGPVQVVNSEAGGTVALPIDLTMIPQPNGFAAVSAGETWNFQLWHRDATGGVGTSNFSNGLEIAFQ